VERKLVALLFVALLVGLGGGYGLGYVIYQPQVQKLQNNLNNLNGRFDVINSTLTDTRSSVTSLQSELNILESEVTSLNSTVESIGNGLWHKAMYFKENGTGFSVTFFSENFQIRGNWMRIRWIADASYITLADFHESWIIISVRFSNGTEYTHRKTFVGTFSSMTTDMDITPGEYYLAITIGSAISEIVVVVWEYY